MESNTGEKNPGNQGNQDRLINVMDASAHLTI